MLLKLDWAQSLLLYAWNGWDPAPHAIILSVPVYLMRTIWFRHPTCVGFSNGFDRYYTSSWDQSASESHWALSSAFIADIYCCHGTYWESTESIRPHLWMLPEFFCFSKVQYLLCHSHGVPQAIVAVRVAKHKRGSTAINCRKWTI